MNNFFKKNKIGIVLTLLILILGSSAYYYVKPLNNVEEKMSLSENSMTNLNPLMFKNMEIKVAYTPDRTIKLFANARNNDLSKLIVTEGESIPEKETIIIGFDEAKMMKEEKLFEKTGDKIENLFGVNVTIGGVYNKTGTIIDEMHFVSEENYKNIKAQENKVFIELTSDNVSKVFYTYELNETLNFNVKLTEGKIENYKIYSILDKNYYPLIIGSKEAKMMKEEKLFEKTGDTIEGFFGTDVIIVGIIDETNTSLDMMHLIPLAKEDLN